MIFRQAFKSWGQAPRNMILARNSRDAVEKVLLKRYGDVDLEQFTADMAERIFRDATEPRQMKFKAASVLVYVLDWGADHGFCKRPCFDYNIAGAADSSEHACLPDKEQATAELSQPVEKSPEEVPAAAIEEPKDKQDMNTEGSTAKRRGKAPRSVAQIDPETLEVVKVWPSMGDAQRTLGACNIDRCIEKLRKSAGFYWSNADDVDTFKCRLGKKLSDPQEKPVSANAVTPNPAKKKLAFKAGDRVWCALSGAEYAGKHGVVMHVVNEASAIYRVKLGTTLYDISEQNLRYYPSGDIETVWKELPIEQEEVPAALKALEVFTDQELVDELIRRGWEGDIQRMQVITLKAKGK